MTIEELQEAMFERRLRSVEIAEAYLARIRAYDDNGPRLNAVIRLNRNALAEAAAADEERARGIVRGPLHGIPVLVKDNIDVAGMQTSAGSLALAGLMPVDDAHLVRRLREAGAVILGKTNMHELAGGITTRGSLGGQTRNPYDLDRNPGGSSGGTGAAIAASFAAVGWGTDGCGSIRVPASQNNLFGLRPTKGVSSIDGILTISHSHDVVGPLARTVRDLALALDGTIGPDPSDPATSALAGLELPSFVAALDGARLQGTRIGVFNHYFDQRTADEEPYPTVRKALEEMASLGAVLIPVEIPGVDEMVRNAIVMNDEFKWDLQDYLAQVPDPPVRSLQEILALGLVDEQLVPLLEELDRPTSRTTVEYLTALVARDALGDAIARAMDGLQLDAIAYPTVQRIPSHLDDPQLGSNCALSSNSGFPALSMPAGFTPDGLPVGLELLARPFDDARLVALAYAFEQATNHRRAPPSSPPLTNGQPPAPMAFSVLATGTQWDPPTESPVEAAVHILWDPELSRLEYQFEVRGVAEDDLYGLVFRSLDAEQRWSVVETIAAPGELSGSGVLDVHAVLRERLEAGHLFLDVFTRQHPFGAGRARIRLPDRSVPGAR
jgi:Asp-tRNA(Asn)/Glu-tRNA(Gln) amidotransferase A subunit family amidase